MEIKKTMKADLENKRLLFTEIGIAMSLTAALCAFEWSCGDTEITRFVAVEPEPVIEEMLPITREEVEEPEPPKPVAPIITDVMVICEDAATDEDWSFIAEDEPMPAPVEVAPVEEEAEDDACYEIFSVEREPMFPGGRAGLSSYLAREVHYPQIALENGVEGRVYVKFVVDKNGKVTDVHLARPADPHLSKEALRVVTSMPDWTPGVMRGRNVRVAYTVPINFKLEN